MQGGDISNEATPRIWVHEDVLFTRQPAVVVPGEPEPKPWWKKMLSPAPAPGAPAVEETITVDRAAMTVLWRYTQKMSGTGLRVEVLHIGDGRQADSLLHLADSQTSSPVTDVVVFSDLKEAVDALAYRPDVIVVVAEGRDMMRFGSRGASLGDLV